MRRHSDTVMPEFRHQQVEADNRAWVVGKLKAWVTNAFYFVLGMALAVAAPWVLALAGATTLVGGR